VRQLDDGWKVIIRDLRYVDPQQETAAGIGMAIVELDDDLEIQSVRQ